MTHVEILEHLIEVYQEEFNKYPNVDEETVTFRRGMIFALKVATSQLKEKEFNMNLLTVLNQMSVEDLELVTTLIKGIIAEKNKETLIDD